MRPGDVLEKGMRTKFNLLKIGLTLSALIALAVETGAGHKFG
jgi:hypothetical protein